MRARAGSSAITIVPATAERWGDLQALFGVRGACAGCWCMWWRLPAAAWTARKGEGNRRALRALVAGGSEPGLIAYAGDQPVGWIAVAPRPAYPRLARSRVLAAVDDRPVWSVTCFFVARAWRRQGLTVALLKAAAGHARSRGARILEGYPVEPKKAEIPPVFAFTGLPEAYRRAGFREVARRSPTRPIMRRVLRAVATAPPRS